ncbi:MAG: creatinase [Bacilli bacterium]|nr:creatinase [Bacilli bacterium]
MEKYENVLIERQENFSLLCGGRGHINLASEKACGALLLQPGRQTLISNNIEIYRLLQEEADTAGDWEIRFFPWQEDHLRAELLNELTGGQSFVTDQQIAGEMVELRTVLSVKEIALARELGETTAEGLGRVCGEIRKGMTEYEVAGRVAQTFISQGIDPIVNLVGSDERLLKYRHFLPTDRTIEKSVILSVVTRYKGLAVSATRSVHFGPMDDEIKQKAAAVRRIDANLTAHTEAGQVYSDLFNRLVQWYGEAGYPEEWKNHHQGGLAGYLPREERLLPGSPSVIKQNQLFAWNPSLPGAKSEDTLLVTDNGPEILTSWGNFPHEEISLNGKVIRKTTCLIR